MSLLYEFKQNLLNDPEKWEEIFFHYKVEYPSLDKQEFEKFLLKLLTLLDKSSAWKSQELSYICEIIFSRTLEMLCKKVIGESAYYPEFYNKWEYFLKLLGENCFKNFSFLFSYFPNAILNLLKEKKFPIEKWLESFAKLFPLCNTEEELIQVGFILAWKFGLAKYREVSLSLLNNVSTQIINAIFQIKLSEEQKKLFISYLKKNPWNNPNSFFHSNKESQIRIHLTGGYLRLDGVFLNPPTFYKKQPNILTDGEKIFQVYADYFGVSFVSISADSINFSDYKTKLNISISNNHVIYKNKSFLLPAFPENFTWRVDSNTFYIVSNFTNYILVGGFDNENL